MAENVQKIISIELQANSAIDGLKQLNAQIEQNKVRMKELADTNQKGSAEYAKLEQHTKALSRTKKALSRETQNEIKLEYEEKGSLNALRAELSNLTKQYDQLSKAERENINVGGRLKNQINQVTNEIKAAEEGTQRYYRNVGNYQNAILNALGMNGRFGQSIMALTGMQGGFTGAMSSMASSVKAFGASLMALLTNPVFLAIAGIAGVGMAFKWFYDYNEGLAEATRLTREFTGYAGDDLVAFRNQVQATADVMDKDFKETLQAADAVMANFHVDGEQAMDIINKGFAAGADVNGDFLGKVQQLAPTFHDAGIAADQMVAIITQTRSGIFTDQGLEAIKQGSARIREMSNTTKQALQGIGIDVDQMQAKLRDGSMTTFDAIQQVSAQLKTLPDNAQEVGEVMSAVFGRQGKFASQEMIESLAEMSTNLDDVMAKTGEYGELLLENIDTEEELDNVTSALFDLTNKGWEEIKQQAIIYAKKALVAVVKGLVDVANWFIKLYNSSLPVRAAVNMIATQFKIVWAAAKWAFNNIINGFKTIGRGISAVVNGFSQAGNAIKAFGEGVALIFKGIANASWETIQQGWKTLSQGIKHSAQSAFDGLKSVVEQGAVDFVTDAKALGMEVGNAVIEGIQNTVSSQWKPITIPNFSGGGSSGGGGGTGTGGGTSSGGGSRSGGGGRNRGGSSSRNNADDEAKKERDRIEKLANDLITEAQKVEQKALQELAKTDEKAIDKLFKKRKEEVEKKYADLFSSGLLNATQKEDLKKAQKAVLDDLEKQREDAIIDLQTKEKNLLLQNQIAATNDAKKRHQLELQQLDNQKEAELKKVGEKEELRNAIIANFAQKRQDMVDKFAKEQLDATQKLLQTQMEGQAQDEEGRLARHKQNLELLRLQQQEELAQYENNEAMQLAIKEKYKQQELQLEQEYANKEREIQYQRYEAIAAVAGGLGQLMSEFQDENKSALAASKILALAEIMISQAVAIANAVEAGSNATNPWQMIAQIATSVTAVTVAMVQAFKSLNSAKFATGGYIQGAGTSTSDSIPVRVSNGESIMNANTTAMFGGLLSSLNQLGGGVPIQVQETASSVRGEDMLARAVARGVAMLPAPVVSVQDINDGQRQVEVMNERATL